MDAGKTPAQALVEGNNHNRDKSRSPMQWNGNTNAGFSADKPWIKVHENYKQVNVETNSQQEKSMLNTYKALLKLRNNEKTLQYGSYEKLIRQGDVILFTRTYQGDNITVMINFGKQKSVKLPKTAKILMGNKILQPNAFLIYRNK